VAKEYWYFICGVLVVLVPLLLLVAVKKLHLLDVRPDHTITYTVNGNQALLLHGFRAKNANDDAPTPALLLFHGGRWLYGGPQDMYPQCQFFAEHGYHCFAAQYRLGSNNRPDVRGALADANAALHYLQENADILDVDPQRIVIGGSSAGGHLAAAVGSGLPGATVDGPVWPAQRPAAQVLYNPMLDLAPGTPDHHLVKDHWEQISPYQHIDASVPPTLILLGSDDPEVPVATAQAFCDAVVNAGSHCEIALYEGQGHGFFHQPAYRDQTNRRILAFLQQLHL
jgi:acetyl esterase/lipase